MPASDRLCDAVMLAFALWTVCAHLVVVTGGDLVTLISAYALAVAAGLPTVLWFGRTRAVPPPVAEQPATPPDPPDAGLPLLRAAVLAAGLILAVSVAGRPGPFLVWWSGAFLLGVGGIACGMTERYGSAAAEPRRPPEPLLWLLAVACAGLSLIAHRPDADDAFYVNIAVAAADFPRQALFSVDTLHGVASLPLYLPVYRVHSFELLNGALAYLTGIPAIYSFHWLAAAGAAFLVPLAHAKLFRLLTPRFWLWAVAVLSVILVAAGEPHRWYGNFAFVRMWQGKAIALSVFMPLVYAYGIRFAARPNPRDWAKLAAAQIAAVGATSSALWVAPAGAFMALCSAAGPSRDGGKAVVVGSLASSYVVVVAWLVKGSLRGVLGSAVDQGGPTGQPLYSAMITVLGDSRLLLFGLTTLLISWILAPPGVARRFAIVFPLGVWVGVLNPYAAGWVSANVTGPSYWRSLWALPLPILMTLVLTAPLRLERPRWPPWVGPLLCVASVAAFAVFVPGYGGLAPQNGVRLSWPGLKVPLEPYRWAAAVNESVPPGATVAVPAGIDAWVVTFHDHAYPLSVRHYVARLWERLGHDDVERRLTMQRWLSTPQQVEASPERFREGLERFGIRAVCMANTPGGDTARAVLRQAGFRRTLSGETYELWVRPGPVVPAAHR